MVGRCGQDDLDGFGKVEWEIAKDSSKQEQRRIFEEIKNGTQ